jgi:integrase/recombinase XerD
VPNSPIFCEVGNKNRGRRLSPRTVNAMYENYKSVYFPKLLDDALIPEEDKRKIRDLLKKRWNPYVRRHTAATELSKTLKDPVLIDKYLGWSHQGNTRQKYQHYYADDAFDAILQADGLILMGTTKKKKKDLLKPKQCPNCDETNIPDTKFCIKCRYVLSYDAYNETIEEKERTAREAEENKKELEEMKRKVEGIDLAVRALIGTGVVDPLIEEHGGSGIGDGAAYLQRLVEKRREELVQRRGKGCLI